MNMLFTYKLHISQSAFIETMSKEWWGRLHCEDPFFLAFLLACLASSTKTLSCFWFSLACLPAYCWGGSCARSHTINCGLHKHTQYPHLSDSRAPRTSACTDPLPHPPSSKLPNLHVQQRLCLVVRSLGLNQTKREVIKICFKRCQTLFLSYTLKQHVFIHLIEILLWHEVRKNVWVQIWQKVFPG